jgi:general secretion pathway protein L
MLASFCSWWIARLQELLPPSWTNAGGRASDGIVVDMDSQENITASIRHNGRHEPVTLGVAARRAGSRPVVVRAPPGAVLEKHHVVPAAPRRELNQMLRFELARITPFNADDVFWRWDGRPRPGDRSRTDIVMTLVPKVAVAAALEALANVGIQPRFIEAGPPDRPRLLPIADEVGRSLLLRTLAWTCAGLAVIAMVVPLLLQELAIRSTDSAIEDLQPAMKQIEALRRGITADGAGRDVVAQETDRTGDVLQVLAGVTRILPDDTYLTDFSLRDRQVTLGGRSAAAARLITSLSADPMIRDAAFAAPVTRIEGATTDLFSIRAGVAR